jgi:hypothetical protein
MSSGPGDSAAHLLDHLRTASNADGGWPYFRGKASRLEPTCWAVLALRAAGGTAEDASKIDAALRRLESWQQANGLISELPSAPPNLAFNGLAAIVILATLAPESVSNRRTDDVARRLLAGINETKGVRLEQSTDSRQDARLVGWPWIAGTFSWVEPTAWCLLALKKASLTRGGAAGVSRVAEAERMLADRCGTSGGWNVGSTNILGREVWPFVPTTSVGLLALQDRPSMPEVERSVDWLLKHWRQEQSPLALALTLIALNVHGIPSKDPERALLAHVAQHGVPDNLTSLAVILYALTGEQHRYADLRI